MGNLKIIKKIKCFFVKYVFYFTSEVDNNYISFVASYSTKTFEYPLYIIVCYAVLTGIAECGKFKHQYLQQLEL